MTNSNKNSSTPKADKIIGAFEKMTPNEKKEFIREATSFLNKDNAKRKIERNDLFHRQSKKTPLGSHENDLLRSQVDIYKV